jgi:two-component system LytT family response regulator
MAHPSWRKATRQPRRHLDRPVPEWQPLADPQDDRETEADPAAAPRLLIGEREHRLYPLEPQKIDYIKSDGNYVSIRVNNTAYISRDSIKRLEGALAQFGFIRIERSLLVNVRAVLYAETAGRGRFAFTLASGARVQSSASYRDAILKALPLASSSRRASH